MGRESKKDDVNEPPRWEQYDPGGIYYLNEDLLGESLKEVSEIIDTKYAKKPCYGIFNGRTKLCNI